VGHLLRAAGLLASVLVLAGCALSGEGKADEVTREQLAVMVLPADNLGGEYAAFEVDDDSGPTTARDVADSTVDPDDTGASIKRAGWTAGYDLMYADPVQARLAAEQRHGALSGGTSADLFATETDARAFIVDFMGEYQRSEGKTIEGVKLVAFESFDVSAGDEAWGAEFAFRGNTTVRMTGVLFRHGRIVASTYYLRTDDADLRSQAASAAQALDRRIEKVLAGDLDAEPVPVPAKKVIATRTQLARMTLSAKDLPGDARVAEEGRYRGGANYVSYYRNFDVSNTMVGSSHLLFLRAQTDVFETEKGAEAVMRYLGTAKGRALFAREVQRNIRRDFKRAAAGRPLNFDVRDLANAGPGARGIVITFDLPSGRYRIASIFVRSGRAVAMVSGFCNAHAVHPEDMPPLGEEARERLASVPV
jgi:hypothetical protein